MPKQMYISAIGEPGRGHKIIVWNSWELAPYLLDKLEQYGLKQLRGRLEGTVRDKVTLIKVVQSYGLVVKEISIARGEHLQDEHKEDLSRAKVALNREGDERRHLAELHATALKQVQQILQRSSSPCNDKAEHMVIEFATALLNLTIKEQLTFVIQAPPWLRQHELMIGWFRRTARAVWSLPKSLLQTIPNDMIRQEAFWGAFQEVPAPDQVDIVWEELTQTGGGRALWPYLSVHTKLLAIYKAAQSGERLSSFVIGDAANEHPLVRFALLILSTKDDSRLAPAVFDKARDLLESWIVTEAFHSTERFDLTPLLPRCRPGLVQNCEGRPWRRSPADQSLAEALHIWCPRASGECLHLRIDDDSWIQKEGRYNALEGAHVYARTNIAWTQWSMLELFESCGVTPVVEGMKADEYVSKRIGGWVNRINEIRERLKCRHCHQIMIPDPNYAKNLAVYSVTVMNCPGGYGHDEGVYFSHCWACWELIDSRESPIRHEDYYLCINCGSGREQSPNFAQGDICPKCGTPQMDELDKNHCVCRNCKSTIQFPRLGALTGWRARGAQSPSLSEI